MLTVLLLTGVEKLVNAAIKSDPITQSGLTNLAGKTLRLRLDVPNFALDTYFYDDHVRLEPVTKMAAVFEPSEPAYTHGLDATGADCTVHVKNVAQLLNLLQDTSGNLPIAGDYKVLMQVKQLLAGFDPDIAGQLEPLIGTPLASQLGMVITHLKGQFSHTAKQSFYDVTQWANEVTGNAKPDPDTQAQTNDLHQQLLKLRADVEREEARLQAIKLEQAQLKNQKH